MTYTQGDLNMAERRIAEGQQRIEKQERIVRTLRARGQPTELAEELLKEFVQTLRDQRTHRDLIAEYLKSNWRI